MQVVVGGGEDSSARRPHVELIVGLSAMVHEHEGLSADLELQPILERARGPDEVVPSLGQLFEGLRHVASDGSPQSDVALEAPLAERMRAKVESKLAAIA